MCPAGGAGVFGVVERRSRPFLWIWRLPKIFAVHARWNVLGCGQWAMVRRYIPALGIEEVFRSWVEFSRDRAPKARIAQETERFFRNNPFPWDFYGGSCGIALNSTSRRHPRLGLVSGSRGPSDANPHPGSSSGAGERTVWSMSTRYNRGPFSFVLVFRSTFYERIGLEQ